MHVVILIAAAAAILRLLRRILPARLASRLPEMPAQASGIDHRRVVVVVLAAVAALLVITMVDLGALAVGITDVFRRMHGLDQ